MARYRLYLKGKTRAAERAIVRDNRNYQRQTGNSWPRRKFEGRIYSRCAYNYPTKEDAKSAAQWRRRNMEQKVRVVRVRRSR